jgi:hypothetical protein
MRPRSVQHRRDRLSKAGFGADWDSLRNRSEVSWGSVASRCVDRSVNVAVAACNNHVELVAVLAIVQCIGLANRSSPIDTLRNGTLASRLNSVFAQFIFTLI